MPTGTRRSSHTDAETAARASLTRIRDDYGLALADGLVACGEAHWTWDHDAPTAVAVLRDDTTGKALLLAYVDEDDVETSAHLFPLPTDELDEPDDAPCVVCGVNRPQPELSVCASCDNHDELAAHGELDD